MKKKLTSRRELLKTTAFSGAALAAASLITSCTKKEESEAPAPDAGVDEPKDSDTPYVSQDSPKAKALKYYENAAEADAELRGKKGNTEGSEQFCNNCQFYSADTEKCTLFPGKRVKSEAWCVSWSLKAQV